MHRVCRRSLAAETFALADAMDIALRSKVLIVEMFTGRFLKASLDGWEQYSIQTPFGLPPTTSEISQEVAALGGLNPKESPNAKCAGVCPLESPQLHRRVQDFQRFYIDCLRVLTFADSANAVSAVA